MHCAASGVHESVVGVCLRVFVDGVSQSVVPWETVVHLLVVPGRIKFIEQWLVPDRVKMVGGSKVFDNGSKSEACSSSFQKASADDVTENAECMQKI